MCYDSEHELDTHRLAAHLITILQHLQPSLNLVNEVNTAYPTRKKRLY